MHNTVLKLRSTKGDAMPPAVNASIRVAYGGHVVDPASATDKVEVEARNSLTGSGSKDTVGTNQGKQTRGVDSGAQTQIG